MRLTLVAIQMLVLLLPLAAEDQLGRYFGDAPLEKLRAGKTLFASIPANGELSLVPAISTKDVLAADVRDRKPSIGVEMTSLIAGLPQQMDTKEGWLLLYNSLHAVSTMKGITYYSVTRGTTHVLFTNSYVIDSAEKKNRLDDPIFSEIPSDNIVLTFQDDTSFGGNVYEESFSYRDDHLLVKMDNLTTISFLFFPIIQPRNLVSRVALIPSGNDVVFYGLSYLNTGFPMGDHTSREDSLKNRLVAMENWLKARLEAQ